MTKKGLLALLSNADIMKANIIKENQMEAYDESAIQQDSSGNKYILEKNELSPEETDTALLAQISISLKTIRSVSIYIAVVLSISTLALILIFLSINRL